MMGQIAHKEEMGGIRMMLGGMVQAAPKPGRWV
jgi:hypothetical protein